MSGFHPYQAVLRQQLEERQGSVELVLLEAALDDDLRCEGENHPNGGFGHVIGAPAEYAVRLACGHRYLMCGGWVQALAALVACGTCRSVTGSDDAIVVPI